LFLRPSYYFFLVALVVVLPSSSILYRTILIIVALAPVLGRGYTRIIILFSCLIFLRTSLCFCLLLEEAKMEPHHVRLLGGASSALQGREEQAAKNKQ
jgi:hypothetical protein